MNQPNVNPLHSDLTTQQLGEISDKANPQASSTASPDSESPLSGQTEGSMWKRMLKASMMFLLVVFVGAGLKRAARKAVRANIQPPAQLLAAAEQRSERLIATQEAWDQFKAIAEQDDDDAVIRAVMQVTVGERLTKMDPVLADYFRNLRAFFEELQTGVARHEAAIARLDREAEQLGEAAGFLTYLISDDDAAERNRRGGEAAGGLMAFAGQTNARLELDQQFEQWMKAMEGKGNAIDAQEEAALLALQTKYGRRISL